MNQLSDLGPASWDEPLAPVELPLSSNPADLLPWLDEIFNSGFNTAHPAFLAYIPGGGLVTSALADFIIKVMNRYGTAPLRIASFWRRSNTTSFEPLRTG